VLYDVEVPLEHVGELRPLALLLVQHCQRAERLGIFTAQIEHALPALDRALQIAQALRGQVGHLGADLGLLDVAHGVVELALVDLVELVPVLGLLVDATEGRDGVLVGRRELIEDHAVRADRVRDLRQALLVHLPQAGVELDLVDAVLGGGGALFQHAGELGPLLERAVDAIEVGQGVALGRRHRQDVTVGLLGLGDVRQLLLEHTGELLADHGQGARRQALDAEHVRVSVGQ
jgi:hypothetical protein